MVWGHVPPENFLWYCFWWLLTLHTQFDVFLDKSCAQLHPQRTWFVWHISMYWISRFFPGFLCHSYYIITKWKKAFAIALLPRLMSLLLELVNFKELLIFFSLMPTKLHISFRGRIFALKCTCEASVFTTRVSYKSSDARYSQTRYCLDGIKWLPRIFLHSSWVHVHHCWSSDFHPSTSYRS